MVNKLFEYIGSKIKESNKWIDSYSVNCVALTVDKANRIVNLEGFEKEEASINDYSGYGFYIKLLSKINFTPSRKLTSCDSQFQRSVDFSFVFYAVDSDKELSVLKLENLFSNNLRQMNFSGYTGEEKNVKITINNSNPNAIEVFKAETGKDFSSGSNLIAVQINAKLVFEVINENCPESCIEDLLIDNCITE